MREISCLKIISLISGIILMSDIYALEIVAHRGECTLAPQNSLPAFKKAWAGGVKTIEADFYATKEGEIVCMHAQQDLKNLTGLDKPVEDLAKDDLATADLGSAPEWSAFKGTRIPLMDDVLATIPAYGKIYFEIKGYDGGLYEKKIKAAMQKYNLKPSQIVFISFNAKFLEDILKRLPEHEAYLIYSIKDEPDLRLSYVEAKLKKMPIKGVDASNSPLLTAEYVAKVKARGLRFCVWTVNDIERAKELAKMGVDAVTTNIASAMRNALQKDPSLNVE